MRTVSINQSTGRFMIAAAALIAAAGLQAGAQQGFQQQAFSGQGQNREFARIAVDFNNDGQFDVVEFVPAQQVQQWLSQQRMHAQPWGDFQQRDRFEQTRGFASQSASYQLIGEIQDQRTIQLAGENEQHVLATLMTTDGERVPVDLGPQSQLRNANIARNQQVQVFGTGGFINDRPVLIAHELSTQQGTHRIHRSPQAQLIKLRGELLDQQSMSVQGVDQPMTVAQVRTMDGNTYMVNLGSQRELRQANLQSGKRVEMLVQPASMGGRPMFQAKQLRVDDRTIDIESPREGAAFQGSQMQRQGQAQGQMQGHMQGQMQGGMQSMQGEVTGQVINMRNIRLNELDDQMTIVRLRTNDGRELMALLGPQRDLRNANVRSNSTVRLINPQQITIDGQQAWISNPLEVNGQQVRINAFDNLQQRSFSMEGSGAQSGQQQQGSGWE